MPCRIADADKVFLECYVKSDRRFNVIRVLTFHVLDVIGIFCRSRNVYGTGRFHAVNGCRKNRGSRAVRGYRSVPNGCNAAVGGLPCNRCIRRVRRVYRYGYIRGFSDSHIDGVRSNSHAFNGNNGFGKLIRDNYIGLRAENKRIVKSSPIGNDSYRFRIRCGRNI